MRYSTPKGFTLIELLVVISIIGLLSTLAIVALSTARQRSRDAKRVSDMKQLQTAIELFFDKNKTYKPAAATCGVAASAVSACTATTSTSGVEDGLANELPGIAQLNDPSSSTLCTSTSTSTCNYAFTALANTTSYTITFYLESGTGDLAAGRHTLAESGIR